MPSPRKQPDLASIPKEGTASPFGGGIPFPLVVLPGGVGARGPSPGREIFDAWARGVASAEVTARQALVRALRGDEFPWGAKPGASVVAGSVAAPGGRERENLRSKDDGLSERSREPAREAGRPKLRIANRATAALFPSSAGAPGGVAGASSAAAPSPVVPLPPVVPLAGWPAAGADTSPPMLPLPEPGMIPPTGRGTATPWGGAGTRSPWPAAAAPARPVRSERAGEAGSVFTAGKAPRGGRRGAVVAGALSAALVLGAGAWWQGEKRAREAERASVAARAARPPAPVAPADSGPKRPSEAFEAWARHARIKGVLERESGQVRALVNGRLVVEGDYADALLQLRLVGVNKEERRLIFEERGEARLEVNY